MLTRNSTSIGMESAERSAPVRMSVLRELGTEILALRLSWPVRVAIDGRTASGKTVLADDLAAELERAGRPVIRTSIDGFHRPKAERYARGRHSAEGYYYDGRDLAAINRLLLDPLGPEGDGLYRTASFDLERDCPVDEKERLAPKNAILVVDGTFLQRPELRSRWDFTVFVDTSPSVCEARGIHRDTDLLGGVDAARALYASRYRPAFEIYQQLCHPAEAADVRIINDDFSNPRLEWRRRVSNGGRDS
jgi:uridine kinase